MPETNTSQQMSAGAHYFKPVSRTAFDLFCQHLPKLLVFVSEKFQLENKYLCEDASCT